MAIKIKTATLDDLTHKGLVLGFFSDERPPRGYGGFVDWRLNGIISRQIAAGKLTGNYLEKVLLATDGRLPSSQILMIGLGNLSDLTYDVLYSTGCTFSETVMDLKWNDFVFEVPAAGRCGLELPIMTEAVLTGFFDAFSKDIERLQTISPVLLIREERLDQTLAGVERFKKNIRGVIPIELDT